MAADQDTGADAQDKAETFDETNITRDGQDIAHPDMARDVFDLTSAAEDSDDEDDSGEDFDPDTADEDQLDLMMDRNDGIDEARTFVSDDADLVATDDVGTADYESRRLSDDDLDKLGYGSDSAASKVDRRTQDQLDRGLGETFPASDPVSINPGAD